MRTYTQFTLWKRFLKLFCVFTFVFSSALVYGQDPLPTIVPNTNRGLPFLYALPDNNSELFSVTPDPTANPLPSPTVIGTDRTFDGEGSGFRASNRKVYAFDDDHDLYELDPETGNSTLLVNNMFPGVVQGVDFYLNNMNGDEVMFVIGDSTGDGNGGEKLYAFDPNNNWASYAGYPKVITGGDKRYDGIAWNPETGDFYVQTDDDVDFYIMDVSTANTTFAFSTEFGIDGEGIGFAADGKLYIEDEDEDRFYEVDISNGDLTEVAKIGGGDIEGIMGNVGVRDDGGDSPNSYGWAAHQLPVLESSNITIFMGSLPPDAEDPFASANDGSGDDNSGVDDEDGVFLNGSPLDNQTLNREQNYTLNIPVTGAGVLNAWADWDGNGEFDNDEQIADNVSPTGGSIDLNISVPGNAEFGITYARFRYSSEHDLTPAFSEAADGEVEDYQFNIAVFTRLALIKTGVFNDENGDNMGQPGETISYTFIFRNLGDQKIKDITLTDDLPGIQIDGNSFDLNAGDEKDDKYSATYAITQADVDQGRVENQAFASGEGYNDGLTYSDLSDFADNDLDRPTVVYLATRPEIAMIKTGVFNDENGNNSADIGETISYSFELANTGNTTLQDIVVTDPLITVDGSLSSLDPLTTDTSTFTATYPITQDDINNGFVVNQARVESCLPYQVVDPEGCCEGKVINLTLEYLGSTNNVNVRIESGGEIIYDDFVNQGDQFYIEGTDPDGTFPNNNLELYIDNNQVGDIHVSCSQPIGPGLVIENLFEVISGESLEGGELCPLEGEPGVATFPPDGCCDGGVTELTLEFIGSNNNVNVRIENGNEILFNDNVSQGDFIFIEGTDNDGTFNNNSVDLFVDNNMVGDIHVSCSQPVGPGLTIAGMFEIVSGASRDGGELCPVSGSGCLNYNDLSDNNSFDEDDPTIVPLPFIITPTPRDCNCSPIYKDSNFENPALITGDNLQVGAVYRFSNVFPTNPYGTTLDALVRIEEFSGGATLLDIDVSGTGLEESFQPRINSTNDSDQSVLFSITFVEGGGDYGDEVEISVYGTPLDIDGDGVETREYAEVNLPDAYFINNNTVLNIFTGATIIRGEASTTITAPGGDVSLDPRFTFSNYWENVTSVNYRIGKIDGNDDRYYSFNLSCADYDDPNSVLFTYPVICGNVSDQGGDPLANVDIDIIGDDGSSQTVQTDGQGNYMAVAEIPEDEASVIYEIRENDPPGYISISDVDGANDNLITREIELASSCGNDFVDGLEGPTGWFFECEDKVVDEYGYNAKCVTNTVVAIPGTDIYQYVVEIVYKGDNPGQSIEFTDSGGNTNTLFRSVPIGGSSNVWVYRGLFTGSTTSVNYIDNDTECNLQSVVVFAFRENQSPVSSSAGVFTSRSGYNDIQTITIDIPAFTDGPRNLTIETPISELTEDGRYLLLRAEIGGVSDELFIYGPDGSLPGGTCCLAIPSITLNNVPGNETEVTITVDTRNNQNGQSVNGQSWVIASAINVDGDCPNPNSTYAFNDFADTLVNTPVSGNVLTNDVDLEGDNQVVTNVGTFPTSAGGTITIAADGSYTYTPPAGFTGTDTFEYFIADDGTPTATDSAFVFINVVPPLQNTTTANADNAETYVDVPVVRNATNGLLSNDDDAEGDNQVVTSTGVFPTTQGGSITVAADGSYTYTPPAGFVGDDTFTYTIEDDGTPQATDSAVLTITVYPFPPPNDTFAYDDFYFAIVDTPLVVSDPLEGVLANDVDLQGDTQTVDIAISPISGPANGTVSINADGTFTYTPNAGYFGPDEFVYEIFDDGTPFIARDQATVRILIPTPNTTYAFNDFADTLVNTPVSGNVLTNDVDLEGDNQVVTNVGTFPTSAGGTITIAADGSYTYTPPAGFTGTDTFEYFIADDGTPTATDSAFVFINVVPPLQNTTTANADNAETYVDVPVVRNATNGLLSNDDDAEGDNQVVTSTGVFPTTQGGSITVAADGSYTYTPPAGFVGDDTFTYTIEDDGTPQATDSAVLTITVYPFPPPNDTFAYDDFYFAIVDTPLVVSDPLEGVLANDVDLQGDTQTVDIAISPISGPANGTVSINADGTFTYTPNAGYFGPDEFVYEIFDDGTPFIARDQATVRILIPTPNTTYAFNDFTDTLLDTPVMGNVLTNDEDLEGDNQVVTNVGTFPTSAGGTITIAADGSYTYTPPAGFTGTDTFEYFIADDGTPTATDSATLFINVIPPIVNSTTANADNAETYVDVPVVRNATNGLLSNDDDAEGDNQVVTSTGVFATTQGGSIEVFADGSYNYAPPVGFIGNDTFTYTIEDDGTPQASDSAVLTITVYPFPPPNDTFAYDDFYFAIVDTPLVVSDPLEGVLANDVDLQGDTQTVDIAISPISGPANGTVSINADGTFTYTPNAGYFGPDEFVYEIFDDGTPFIARDQATVRILIPTPNTTYAFNDFTDTLLDTPVMGNVLTNDEDLEGDNQVVTNVGTFPTSAGGTITIAADGSYTYTPPAGFTGTDTFEYFIADDGTPTATDSATLFINVIPPIVNSTTANADNAETYVDVPVVRNATNGLLSNDDDAEGDNQVVTSTGVFPTTQGGSITVAADGSYTYTPPAGFVGDDTFTYTIEDDGTPQATDSAVLTITVYPFPPPNDTFAYDDFYFAIVDTPLVVSDPLEGVLANDVDLQGDTQTVDIAISPISGPANGTVSINADGTFTYTPNAGYFGPDEFVYEIFDDGTPFIARDQATVRILIPTPNTTYAFNDFTDTLLDTPVMGNVLTNDEDLEGDNQVVTNVGTFPTSAGGTITIAADGSYTYTPPAGFTGTDTFEYFIADDGTPTATDSATLFINVIPPIVNSTTANADNAETYVDVPVVRNATNGLLSNDDDAQGDNQVMTSVGIFPTTQGGTIEVFADGSYIYTPPAGFVGDDTFTYTIEDDGTPQATDSAVLTITVYPTILPNTTFAYDDFYFGNTDTPVSGNVLANDVDIEGNDQEVDTGLTPVSGPTNGTVVVNADGTFTYTPNAGYAGPDEFVYEIFDNGTPFIARDQATVHILIVTPPAPSINIVKSAVYNSQCSQVGDEIDYTFTVTNTGNIDLLNVVVDDPLLGGPVAGPASGDTNNDGILQLTETWIYLASYTITQIDIDNGVVNNTATVTGEDLFGTVVTDTSNAVATTLMACPDIEIVKTGVWNDANGDGCADVGEMIDYSFVVTNTGNVTLSNVLVTDPLVTVAGGPIVLTPGQVDSTTFTASYTITQADIDAGFVENEATVEGTAPNGTVVMDTSGTISTTLTACPDIEIVKTGVWNDANGDGCADVGEMIDYSFVVTNTGNVTLSNVLVTDPLVTVAGGPIVLTPGQVDSTTFTASYTITQADIDAGFVENEATVEGTAPNGTVVIDTSGTISTTLTACPDIEIVKTGVWNDANGDGCADVGEMIDYSFVVTNTGNVTLSNVLVTDPLVTVAGGPIVLTPGQVDSTTFTASYTITQADIDAGFVENEATVEGTAPNGTVVMDTSGTISTTLTACADIEIVKTGVWNDANGDGCADVGEMIDYSFVVTNTGNVTLSNVLVTDPLVTVAGGPIVLTPGQVDSTTFTASYTITQADIDAGFVENEATVEGTAPNGTVVMDTSGTISTTLTACPDIEIVKTGVWNDANGDGCADVGEMIDYSFVVTNTGNVTLSNVLVTDPLVTVAGGPIVLTPGQVDSTTFTASYTITQADIDAGFVENEATVEGTAPNGTVVMDTSGTISTTLGSCAAIALIKEGEFPPIPSGGGCPVPGDVIEYTFIVANTGNQTLTDVMVTDPLVTVVGGPITLAVGATDTTTFTATYTITQADVDAGEVVNQATAEGTAPGGAIVTDLSDNDSLLEDDPTIVEICQTPVIALIKVGTFNDENQNKCAEPDETISYAFEVFNQGNVTLTNVIVTDPLVNVQGGPITLAPFTSDGTSFTATYAITQADIDAGFVENQATAEGTSPTGVVTDLSDDDSEFEDDPTVVELCQEPRIALIKTGTPTDENGDGCIDLDETIVYDFVVTNLGNVVLNVVTVTDPMVTVSGGPVTIAAGESDTESFSAIYLVTQEDIDNGFVSNQATVEGTSPSGQVVTDLSDDNSNFENDPTVLEICQMPMISLEKTGVFNDENGDGFTQAGETISYSFTVTNTGDVTLYNITLEDPLPGLVIEGGPIAVLEPGEVDTDTFTATYIITEQDVDNEEVINQALVTAEDGNGNIVMDDSDDPTDLTNTDNDGDGDPDDPTIVDLPVVETAFVIFNGITPNGDGLNDFFELRGIADFPNNNVKIFNRWGVQVFETNGYNETDNVFRGVSDGRSTIRQGEELPTGTYYYILTFQGESPEGKSAYNGYLYINR